VAAHLDAAGPGVRPDVRGDVGVRDDGWWVGREVVAELDADVLEVGHGTTRAHPVGGGHQSEDRHLVVLSADGVGHETPVGRVSAYLALGIVGSPGDFAAVGLNGLPQAGVGARDVARDAVEGVAVVEVVDHVPHRHTSYVGVRRGAPDPHRSLPGDVVAPGAGPDVEPGTPERVTGIQRHRKTACIRTCDGAKLVLARPARVL